MSSGVVHVDKVDAYRGTPDAIPDVKVGDVEPNLDEVDG